MLIHPWDAALDTSEWQDWLASTDRFGMLAVNNLDLAQAPLVLPIHFTLAGDDLLIDGASRRSATGGSTATRHDHHTRLPHRLSATLGAGP